MARPIRVAAAGRMPGDVEQILGGEGQPRKRPCRLPFDAKPLAGDESAEIVGHLGGSSSLTQPG